MSTPFITREMLRDRTLKVAALLCGVALAVLVVAVVGAVRVEAVAAAPTPVMIPDSALRFMAVEGGVDLAGAVALDLFADDRQAPLKRYKLPGEADDMPRVPAPPPVVLGTALADDGGSFAICQLSGGASTVVRLGARIGEYLVVAIERGRVTFRNADGERLSVDATKPVP